jgi:hypothetical protein
VVVTDHARDSPARDPPKGARDRLEARLLGQASHGPDVTNGAPPAPPGKTVPNDHPDDVVVEVAGPYLRPHGFDAGRLGLPARKR